MKKYLFKLLSIALCVLFCPDVFAQKLAYGLVLEAANSDPTKGIYSFDVNDLSKGNTFILATGRAKPRAGAYANDAYYYLGAGDVSDPSLWKVNLEEQNATVIGKAITGILFLDMTYDYSSETMYVIGTVGNFANKICNLYTIDLTNGTCTIVGKLPEQYLTLACSIEGQLYGISQSAAFCKINKIDASVEKLGDLSEAIGIYDIMSMEFDHSDEALYWAFIDADEGFGYLAQIDIKSLTVTKDKRFKDDEQVTGLYFPKVEKPKPIWHAYSLYSTTHEEDYGLVAFEPSDLSTVKAVGDFSAYKANPGAYANGKYYVVGYTDNEQGGIPNELATIDPETGIKTTLSEIEDLPMMRDMTYDYSTFTMYAISREETSDADNNEITGYSSLFILDLETYEWNKVVTLKNGYLGLACTLNGQLYGLAGNGELHKLNRITGNYEIVAATNIVSDPNLPACMEFDHNTDKLYFTYTTPTTINTPVASWLTKLNYKDGAIVEKKQFPCNDQLSGLCIPFEHSKDVPATVTDFTAVAGEEGALEVTLSWTNPTLTVGGAQLTITKAEVIRDDAIIQTIETPVAGEKTTHVDENPANGFHHYVIKIYNETGNGIAVSAFLFVGENIPSAPQNVALTNNGTKATLTWEAPAEGLNTGWINTESLKYNIIRFPDKVSVAKDLTVLKFEEEITAIDSYSYQITAHNAQGIGDSVVSNQLVIGIVPIPYACNFTTEKESSFWTLDENWKREQLGMDGYNYGLIHQREEKKADSWAYSPFIALEQDSIYQISIDICTDREALDSLKIFAGTDKTIASQTIKVMELQIDGKNERQMKTYQEQFQSPAKGMFCIGLNNCSEPQKAAQIYLTNVELVKIPLGSSIEKCGSDATRIYVSGGTVYLEGEYISATVYDRTGIAISTLVQPATSIENLACGIYFIKVTGINGVATQKVVVR